MAEGVLFNVAQKIIDKAGSLLLEEIGLFWGVKNELQKLKNTVSAIQAVILDVEDLYLENNQVRTWVARLRGLLYDADDLLDDLCTEAFRHQEIISFCNKFMDEVCLFFSDSNQIIYWFKIAHEIKDLRVKLDEFKDLRNFHLDKHLEDKPVVMQSTGNMETLKLSYNHLPHHLKQCFAYCSLFSKGHEIEVKELIHLWMAQGYIELPDLNQSFEEIGYAYIMDLLSMSFLQEVKRDKWGNIETCKMHDLMHDLASLVAGDEIITLTRSNVESVGKNTRHISFATGENVTLLSSCLISATKARTFLFLGDSRCFFWTQWQWHGVFSELHRVIFKLKSLRMLDVREVATRGEESLEFEKALHSIYKLKHLRYLNLTKNTGLKRLPNSITRLWNLEVLKLDYCSELKEWPNNMNKLANLKHLSLNACARMTHMPIGIGKLTCLENLSSFLVADCDLPGAGGLHELQFLNKLRGNLTISNLRYVGKNDCEAANLKEKEHVRVLRLEWYSIPYWQNDLEDMRTQSFPLVPDVCYLLGAEGYDNEEMTLEALRPHQNLKGFQLFFYRGFKCSSWLETLTNLVEIVIFDCKNIKYLPAFDHFPSLQSLKISSLTCLEYIDTKLESLFFPSLEELSISNCPNLEGWYLGTKSTSMAEQVSFHCLRHLVIRYCPNLAALPPFPFLEKLRLEKDSMKTLEQMLKLTISKSESSPSSSSSSSSQLKTLEIDQIEGLVFPPEPDELLPSLDTLQYLKVENCSMIISMSNTKWQALKSLHSLELKKIEEMVSLPEGLQYVTTLQHLSIECCPNFRNVPGWVSNLPELQKLSLQGCPQLHQHQEATF